MYGEETLFSLADGLLEVGRFNNTLQYSYFIQHHTLVKGLYGQNVGFGG